MVFAKAAFKYCDLIYHTIYLLNTNTTNNAKHKNPTLYTHNSALHF